jgi:acetoin utilization protein AcuB
MLVSKSMTRKLVTVAPQTGVLTARALMAEKRIRHLPVVEEDRVLIGIVTDRDIRSAMPHHLHHGPQGEGGPYEMERIQVKDIMTPNPLTISTSFTIQDALLLFDRTSVGAFPVVDDGGRLIGIVSVKDMMRAFVNVLGFKEPGTFLGIVTDDRVGQVRNIVDIIGNENIPLGSILVVRANERGRRAVLPYLLSKRVGRLKDKLRERGFEIFDPMQWYLDSLQADKTEEVPA